VFRVQSLPSPSGKDKSEVIPETAFTKQDLLRYSKIARDWDEKRICAQTLSNATTEKPSGTSRRMSGSDKYGRQVIRNVTKIIVDSKGSILEIPKDASSRIVINMEEMNRRTALRIEKDKKDAEIVNAIEADKKRLADIKRKKDEDGQREREQLVEEKRKKDEEAASMKKKADKRRAKEVEESKKRKAAEKMRLAAEAKEKERARAAAERKRLEDEKKVRQEVDRKKREEEERKAREAAEKRKKRDDEARETARKKKEADRRKAERARKEKEELRRQQEMEQEKEERARLYKAPPLEQAQLAWFDDKLHERGADDFYADAAQSVMHRGDRDYNRTYIEAMAPDPEELKVVQEKDKKEKEVRIKDFKEFQAREKRGLEEHQRKWAHVFKDQKK